MLHPNCPFCTENEEVDILRETETAYLIAVLDQSGNVMPKRYFIIPKVHIESVLDLPNDWHGSVKELLRFVPGIPGEPFNLTYNEGYEAGKRVSHVHAWVVLRSTQPEKASYGLGMAGLIDKLDKLDRP